MLNEIITSQKLKVLFMINAERKIQKWCANFTYINIIIYIQREYVKRDEKREIYNCKIKIERKIAQNIQVQFTSQNVSIPLWRTDHVYLTICISLFAGESR